MFNNFHRAIRRWYLFNFKPEYIEALQKRKRGDCPRPSECNCCYMMVRLFPCEYASKKGCLIQETKSEMCKITPIDEKDKSEIQKRLNCKYYWVEECSNV